MFAIQMILPFPHMRIERQSIFVYINDHYSSSKTSMRINIVLERVLTEIGFITLALLKV